MADPKPLTEKAKIKIAMTQLLTLFNDEKVYDIDVAEDIIKLMSKLLKTNVP